MSNISASRNGSLNIYLFEITLERSQTASLCLCSLRCYSCDCDVNVNPVSDRTSVWTNESTLLEGGGPPDLLTGWLVGCLTTFKCLRTVRLLLSAHIYLDVYVSHINESDRNKNQTQFKFKTLLWFILHAYTRKYVIICTYEYIYISIYEYVCIYIYILVCV